MKVLHLAHYFLPHPGGEEKYAYYLGRELIKRGHEVLVLTSSLPGCPATETIDGIKVIRYRSFGTILRNPVTPGMLFPRKQGHDFDLIHAQNEHSFAANVAVILKRRLHLPLIMTCSGRLVFGSRLADTVERLYTRTIGRATLKSADKVIVLSLSEKRRLQTLGVKEKKLAVIPTGVDIGKWDAYRDKDASRFLKKYSLDNRKIVLYSGGISERKGIGYLIKAMPEIMARFPDATALFVGDGDYRGEAEHLASTLELNSRIRFTGRISDEELALAYQSCQVYVLPSLSEGLPATILEAYAFSKPVVATEIDGTRDYFADTAFLVPPRNSNELASAIVRTLSEPETAKARGEKGRLLVESDFTWRKHVDKVLELYEEVIGNKSAGKNYTN